MTILGQVGQIRSGPEHADQAGRVPGGATGELFTLQQHHVFDTTFCQVIGDGATDDATANNDDLSLGRKFCFICHDSLTLILLLPVIVS